MSVVPFTTQAGHETVTQSSQWSYKVVLVHTDKITERQSTVMKDCHNLLSQHVGTLVCKINELDTLPTGLKFFVIPHPNEDLVKKIKELFGKRSIYISRAIVEARNHFRVQLPTRSLAISLTMYHCHVFLVKSCAKDDIRSKINEMCGTVVSSFRDENVNVVITDRADNSYCHKAVKRDVPVVCLDWIKDSYRIALEEDDHFFFHDALEKIHDYKIQPFHGLYFKINTRDSNAEIKNMILTNGGHLVYGEDDRLTHIVVAPGNSNNFPIKEEKLDSDRAKSKPKMVDTTFLRRCVSSGYYISTKEYNELPPEPDVIIKQERRSPTPRTMDDSFQSVLSPVMPRNRNMENQSSTMMPPPTPRSVKQNKQQQAEKVDALMNRALSSIETEATQRICTQMRTLPEPELRIEQTYEPSQHLFWNDSLSKRNF